MFFCVPSVRRNLILVSGLDSIGFCFNFKNSGFTLMNNSDVIGSGSLVDGLYKLHLDFAFASSLLNFSIEKTSSSTIPKCARNNEKSSMLWHKRLGHASRKRLEQLVKDGVLSSLDFSDFHKRVDCINGKLTKKSRVEVQWSSELLELIHIGIYGPFPSPSRGDQKYFISFIDAHS